MRVGRTVLKMVDQLDTQKADLSAGKMAAWLDSYWVDMMAAMMDSTKVGQMDLMRELKMAATLADSLAEMKDTSSVERWDRHWADSKDSSMADH